MKQTETKKLLSLLLCLMLCAAIAMTGCSDNSSSALPSMPTAATVKGEGRTVFPFTVIDADGNETTYEIHTDKTTVGEALLELGLIEGEEGAYGLYVKTVDGITLDYDTDGMYWAFYANGEYAMSGVDQTEIEADTSYAFKADK